MSTSANYFKIGVFVLGGLVTACVILLLLGLGRTLQKPLLIETYLDQSVQGLEIGSQVKYRGVHLGTVHEIGFSRDIYESDRPPEQQMNYVRILVGVSREAYAAQGREQFLNLLRADVARGLRFRLNAQGITGLSYLELDYVNPWRYPPLEITWEPEHLYIPSAPGTLTRLLTSVEQVFRKLEEADVALLLTNLNRLLTTTEMEVRGAKLAEVSQQATRLLSELRASNEELRRILANPSWARIPERAEAALDEFKSTLDSLDLNSVLQRLDRTLATAEGFLAGKEGDLAMTLENLRSLSDNLRAISEMARSYPAGLLLGAPPKPVNPPR